MTPGKVYGWFKKMKNLAWKKCRNKFFLKAPILTEKIVKRKVCTKCPKSLVIVRYWYELLDKSVGNVVNSTN